MSKTLTLTLSNGRTLHFNTPAEDAAIATGMAQDPDTHEPSASEIASMKRPGRPFGSGNKTQVTLRLDTAALNAFKATGPGWQKRMNELLRAAVAGGQVSCGEVRRHRPRQRAEQAAHRGVKIAKRL